MSISVGRVQENIETFPGNVRAIPRQNPTAAKARLQSYAFSCEFLIVQYRGSTKGGRISYKYVHHSATPRPHRKKEPIASSPVTKTE